MSSAERLGNPFHDKESEQFVVRYIERSPLSLEKLSIQDDIVTYTTKDGAAQEFDALELFGGALSSHPENLRKYHKILRTILLQATGGTR